MAATGNYSYQSTNKVGSFSVQSDGYIQGFAQDDPARRFALSQGVLSSAEIFPMWGGVAISETIPAATANDSLGGLITRATSAANITGFAVFDQNFAAVSTPFSPVPLVASGGSVNFYRLGSGARIAVAIQPDVAAALQGGLINQAVTWDLNTQRIQTYEASGSTVSISSMTATFVVATPGNQAYWDIAVVAATSNVLVAQVGDVVNISGATNSGGGKDAAVNGNFTVTSFTDSQHFHFKIANTSSTYIQSGALGGTIVLNYSGGTLNAKILRVDTGNSKVVVYNSATGLATWNTGQACALIEI
jgi:hypothetical protein